MTEEEINKTFIKLDEELNKKVLILQEEVRKLRNRIQLIKATADEGFI